MPDFVESLRDIKKDHCTASPCFHIVVYSLNNSIYLLCGCVSTSETKFIIGNQSKVFHYSLDPRIEISQIVSIWQAISWSVYMILKFCKFCRFSRLLNHNSCATLCFHRGRKKFRLRIVLHSDVFYSHFWQLLQYLIGYKIIIRHLFWIQIFYYGSRFFDSKEPCRGI